MIVITGATGQLGSGVIENLIQKGYDPSNIIALARSEEKAQSLKAKGVQINIGDYNDYSSLVEAFKEADKLLFISSNEMENRAEQQVSTVKAAAEAGVQHIFYTSIQRKSDMPDSPINFVTNSHIATEKAIYESGMNYTLLRNNLYMDILPWVLGENVAETGVFYPANDGQIAYALRSDMAEATANILMSENHENKEYNLSNSANFSFGMVADHLSDLFGKKVNYVNPNADVYKETMLNAGAAPMVVEMLAGFAQGAAQGEFEAGKSDLAKLLGRDAVTYKEFLNGMYATR